MCAIANAKLCSHVVNMKLSEHFWTRLELLDGEMTDGFADRELAANDDAKDIVNRLTSDTIFNVDDSSSGKRGNSASIAVLRRRTEKWYRKHLDFLIERSSLNRQMPLPKFGTIAADEVLALHTIFADVVASRSSVTWKYLINSNRWATLQYTPNDIDDKLDESVSYSEFLRAMLPDATAAQLKAMLRFAPISTRGARGP